MQHNKFLNVFKHKLPHINSEYLKINPHFLLFSMVKVVYMRVATQKELTKGFGAATLHELRNAVLVSGEGHRTVGATPWSVKTFTGFHINGSKCFVPEYVPLGLGDALLDVRPGKYHQVVLMEGGKDALKAAIHTLGEYPYSFELVVGDGIPVPFDIAKQHALPLETVVELNTEKYDQGRDARFCLHQNGRNMGRRRQHLYSASIFGKTNPGYIAIEDTSALSAIQWLFSRANRVLDIPVTEPLLRVEVDVVSRMATQEYIVQALSQLYQAYGYQVNVCVPNKRFR